MSTSLPGQFGVARPRSEGARSTAPGGGPSDQLHERHDASDFETKTQDMVGIAGLRPAGYSGGTDCHGTI